MQTKPGLAILPAQYSIDLVTAAGPAVVIGPGAPDETILSDAKTNLTFLAASGSGTVVAGGGKNSILLGNGNDVIVSTGDDSIVGGGGAETVDATRATQAI